MEIVHANFSDRKTCDIVIVVYIYSTTKETHQSLFGQFWKNN